MYKNRIGIWMIFVAVILIFTACGKNDEQDEREAFTYSEQAVLTDWAQNPIQYVYARDNTIYFSTFAEYVLEDGTEHADNRLYSVNMDGSGLQEIAVDWSKENPNAMIKDIWVEDSHAISMWLSAYDDTKNEPVNVFLKVDESGKELLRKDLNEPVNSKNINDVIETAQGNIIAMADYNVFVFDSELNLQGVVDSDDFMTGIVMSKDGKLICISEGKNDKKLARVLDVEQMKWGEMLSKKLSFSMVDFSLMPHSDYDFCYRNDKGIFGCHVKDEASFCLLDYGENNLLSDEIRHVISEGNEGFLIVTGNPENGTSSLKQYKKISDGNAGNKVQILFGALQFDEKMKRAVAKFNQENTGYQIRTKEYLNEENGDTVEDAIVKLNEDIARGEAPDILDMGLLSGQYVSKGLFEDLTPYFQKDDMISEDDMVASALNALKQNDGLYVVAPEFRMATLIGRADYGRSSSEWNLKKLQEFCREQETDVLPFYAADKIDVLDIFLQCGLSDYLDRSAGQCYFDSKEFEELLVFCNEINVEDKQLMRRDEMIEQRKILWTDDDSFMPQKIPQYKKLFGGEICYMGYPSQKGQDCYFSFYNQVGITSGSNVKEGAWEFISMLLSQQYQMDNINVMPEDTAGIPLRKDCLEQLMKKLENIEDDEMSEEAVQEHLTEQQVKDFYSLVENTNKAISYDIGILKIIREEAGLYFAGERDVRTAMDMIQNRCTTYINE